MILALACGGVPNSAPAGVTCWALVEDLDGSAVPHRLRAEVAGTQVTIAHQTDLPGRTRRDRYEGALDGREATVIGTWDEGGEPKTAEAVITFLGEQILWSDRHGVLAYDLGNCPP